MNYNQIKTYPHGENQNQDLVDYVPRNYLSGYGSPHPVEEDEIKFDIVRIFFYCVKYRWLLFAFSIASIIVGTLITFVQSPKYSANAKIEIVTQGARVFQDLEVLAQSDDARAYETAKQKMSSRELAQRVVFELDLANDKQFLAPTPTFSLQNLLNRVTGTRSEANLSELNDEQRQEKASQLILDNTSVSLLKNTSILSVSYSHPIPQIASQVANQITRSYIEQNADRKGETSNLARQFIESQVRETKQNLQNSERQLVEYAESEGITVTGEEISLISSSILEINRAITEAAQERLAAENLAKQVGDGKSASLPQVFESNSIQQTKLKVAELRAEYQQKLSTLKPGFPEMIRLRAQINELQKQIQSEINAIANSVLIKLEQAKAKEIDLRKKLSELEADQAIFQKKNIQYTILKRDVDSSRKQYDSLIDKLNEVGVGSEIKSANASIIDPAIVPRKPYSPNFTINLATSFLLFSVLSAGVIYISELLNNTFVVPDQIEDELKLPVLGIIPFVEDPQDPLPTSAISEAYRTLRTSVQFTGTDKTLRTLMVTSSEPSEAKTTTVFKLAEGFAALGKNVLIIDADLRKPRMHKVLDMENGMGLSNLLTNVVRSDKVSEIFRQTSHPQISLLSAGTIPPNPTDLLVSNKMGLTIHFCSKKYDLVIVDAPPVMGLSDAPILSRLTDACLFVVSSQQVPRKSAKNAVSRLREVGANIVGVAFTKFDIQKIGYEYGYKYMRDNAYYSYGEADQSLHIEKSKEVHENNISNKLKNILRSTPDIVKNLITKTVIK